MQMHQVTIKGIEMHKETKVKFHLKIQEQDKWIMVEEHKDKTFTQME